MHTNKQKENNDIIEAINFLSNGKFNKRKLYTKALAKGDVVSYNGFGFQQDTWCWVIWKDTDIDKNPEYKGEPLCKVIPKVDHIDIGAILDAQPWVYV